MILRTVKHICRHHRLRRAGIVPQPNVPLFQAGARSGVWTVSPDHLTAESVIYSCGVGDNIAWDLAMIQRFGVVVHAFDPTPNCRRWIEEQTLPPSFQFHPVGIAHYDGMAGFLPPRRRKKFNFIPADPGNATIKAPVQRLTTLMNRLGHECIDVLKLDIEGGEYDVLDDLLTTKVPVRQLLVEFHHNFPTIPFQRTLRTIQSLRSAGFRIFHISERGLEFSFLVDQGRE